jgi:hypothetical protein
MFKVCLEIKFPASGLLVCVVFVKMTEDQQCA